MKEWRKNHEQMMKFQDISILVIWVGISVVSFLRPEKSHNCQWLEHCSNRLETNYVVGKYGTSQQLNHLAWECEGFRSSRPRMPRDLLQKVLRWPVGNDRNDDAILLHLSAVREKVLDSRYRAFKGNLQGASVY